MQRINSTPMHPTRHMQQQQQQQLQIQMKRHVLHGQGQSQPPMQELRDMERFDALGHEEDEEEDLHVNQPDDALLIMEVRGRVGV